MFSLFKPFNHTLVCYPSRRGLIQWRWCYMYTWCYMYLYMEFVYSELFRLILHIRWWECVLCTYMVIKIWSLNQTLAYCFIYITCDLFLTFPTILKLCVFVAPLHCLSSYTLLLILLYALFILEAMVLRLAAIVCGCLL